MGFFFSRFFYFRACFFASFVESRERERDVGGWGEEKREQRVDFCFLHDFFSLKRTFGLQKAKKRKKKPNVFPISCAAQSRGGQISPGISNPHVRSESEGDREKGEGKREKTRKKTRYAFSSLGGCSQPPNKCRSFCVAHVVEAKLQRRSFFTFFLFFFSSFAFRNFETPRPALLAGTES